jgi:MoaA/NifB/PqqE/SkfB family radical SAM enzyme
MTVFCTAPWNGITVREDGHVRTCCVGATSLGNLNDIPIAQIIESTELDQIRHDMLSNKPNLQNCKSCIKLEKHSGLATLKQHYNTFYPIANATEFRLKNLDIRWNNACNLGCMYCNQTLSSTWQDRLGLDRSSVIKHYQDDLLDWILKNVDQLQEIMLAGGEPMLMKQNYALINQLPAECKISIITNLSYDLPNLPCTQKLLDRPRENTLWNISLENTGSQFEYVRNGSKWALVKDNLEYINQHWPDLVSINFVYSMFSAFSITDTVQALHELGIKKINLFVIYGNSTMDVFNMPLPVRLAAAENLSRAITWHIDQLHPEDKDLYPFQGADAILSQLLKSTAPAQVTLNEFLSKIEWYNQYSNIDFGTLWPDVLDLVKKHLYT